MYFRPPLQPKVRTDPQPELFLLQWFPTVPRIKQLNSLYLFRVHRFRSAMATTTNRVWLYHHEMSKDAITKNLFKKQQTKTEIMSLDKTLYIVQSQTVIPI